MTAPYFSFHILTGSDTGRVIIRHSRYSGVLGHLLGQLTGHLTQVTGPHIFSSTFNHQHLVVGGLYDLGLVQNLPDLLVKHLIVSASRSCIGHIGLLVGVACS